MNIDINQNIKDVDGSERFLDPAYSANLLVKNIMGEVENLWGKDKANELADSLSNRHIQPEKATLKNILLLSLSRNKTESMDEALKDYKMLDRVRGADSELDLSQTECEELLEKVYKTFKDTLVTGQFKDLTIDKFNKNEAGN